MKDTFAFAQPWLLLLLLALPLLAWLAGGRGQAPAVVYSSLAPLKATGRRRKARVGGLLLTLLLLGLAALIVALARPQLGRTISRVQASGIDIMLLVDVSRSMLAEDLSIGEERANRLEAVKQVTQKFIESRPNDRIGILCFAGRPYLVSPLTLDHDWLLAQLALEEPTQGTAPGSGMLIASEALLPAKNQTKLIITVTDADQINDGPEPDEVAKAIAPLGIKNHVIQMVDFSDSSRYTASGQLLNEIARITGGQFFKVSDYNGLRNVYRQIDSLEKASFKERKQKAWRELMPWVALPALALLLLEFILGRTVWRRLP